MTYLILVKQHYLKCKKLKRMSKMKHYLYKNDIKIKERKERRSNQTTFVTKVVDTGMDQPDPYILF